MEAGRVGGGGMRLAKMKVQTSVGCLLQINHFICFFYNIRLQGKCKILQGANV